jgi:DNA-binding NarL/FixJ family response regulator
MTCLLLVDDHASSREPLALLLSAEPGIDQVIQVGSVAEAKRYLADVEIAIVDLGLPDGDGVAVIHHLRHLQPTARVLVLTANAESHEATRALAAGAAAVLDKTISLGELRRVLGQVLAGEAITVDGRGVSSRRVAATGADLGPWRLSSREHEVLQALADGLTDKEIGQRLGIGVETVRTHLAGVFGKLGVESRLQALAFAVRWGLVLPGQSGE